MNECAQCQHENPSKANFCNNCGAVLNAPNQDKQRTAQHHKKTTVRLAERRQLTILFCDLVGSTPLSERLDPEEYRQVITTYHQVAEKVIMRNRGHIAQYLGDGLLVYFGYPEGLEEAAKLGIQAGLGILKAVAETNERWKTEGKNPIEIRIGIHTGLVVVDDHLALGESVNIAARLEGHAPHDGLVISPTTLHLAQGWFVVKSLGKQTLKGITEPMEIFQVLEESGVKTRLEVAKRSGLSPLVGRKRELDLLTSYWEKAKKKNGTLILLNGEAGIGKSRLVDTLEAQIAKEPNSWLAAARCSAYQQNSAFFPIIQLFEKYLLQFEVGDTPENKLNKLEGFLSQTDMVLKTEMSLLAEFLSIPSEQFPPLIMSPFAKRQRIMEVISKTLLYKTIDQPVVLVIEDLHWADASTLEWLHMFIDQLSTHTIFTLCTARPNFHSDWQQRPEVTQIDLGRLSTEDMAGIYHHQTKGKKLPKEIQKHITSKTEGVPLFVEELTKMILESDLLVEKGNGYELTRSLSLMSIPSTLQDSLLARLDHLGDVKELVQVGAVLGRDFSFDMLHAVLDRKGVHIEHSLTQLMDAEIFYRQGQGQSAVYQFKHALIQDAAYESLLKSRRQQLHHQVAHVLEHQFIETVQVQPELLAHHYTEAGEPLKAIPIWLRAGQQASQKNAMAEAIAHLEKGIALLPHVKNEEDQNQLELDFRLTLGGSFIVAYGFPHPKVLETFNQARGVAQKLEVSPKLALVLFGLLTYYFNIEEYKVLDEVSDSMMILAKDKENGHWFEMFSTQLVGCSSTIKGEFEKANRAYNRVLEIFDPSLPFSWELASTGYLEISAKGWHMLCLQILGYMDQAKNLADKQLSFAEDHKDSMTLYHIYTFPSLYGLEAREWRMAEEIMEEYLPIVRAFGDPIFTLTAEVYYNIARAFQGDRSAFDKAVNLNNVCFDVGFKAFAVSLSPFIGEQYFLLGEYEAALRWIEKILDHANKTGSRIHNAELYRIKGLTLQALGKPDQVVEKCFTNALVLSREQAAKTFELRAAGALARHWHNQGRTDEAVSILKEVYDWFTEGLDSIDLKEARALLELLKE